jgi:hypothetical protein
MLRYEIGIIDAPDSQLAVRRAFSRGPIVPRTGNYDASDSQTDVDDRLGVGFRDSGVV